MNGFDPTDFTASEFDFDAVGVGAGFGQDAVDFTVGQLATALVVFLHNRHLHTG